MTWSDILAAALSPLFTEHGLYLDIHKSFICNRTPRIVEINPTL